LTLNIASVRQQHDGDGINTAAKDCLQVLSMPVDHSPALHWQFLFAPASSSHRRDEAISARDSELLNISPKTATTKEPGNTRTPDTSQGGS
jgi:hypothetical protein